MPPTPVELMLTTSPLPSNAKLFGAVMTFDAVVQFDVSSSATNASFTELPTKFGNSSERNLKSNVRQFAPPGAVKSVFRIDTSMSVSPRPGAPPLPVLANVPGLGTAETLPLVRIPNVPPSVGKSASGLSDVPFGFPPVIDDHDAPVMFACGLASACEIANAPALSFAAGVTAARRLRARSRPHRPPSTPRRAQPPRPV